MNIRKTISGILAAAVVMTGQTCSPIHSNSFAAANKARVSVHDPSIFKDESGEYFIFGSHIEAARSSDLQSWYRFSNGYAATDNALFGNLSQNLAGAFSWAGENLEDCEGGFSVWAPDVVYNPDYINKDGSKGAYMMYFCTTSTYIRSVIAFGVSQKPEGPYEFVDTLIYSGFTKNDSYATSSTKNVNRKYTSTNVDELIAGGQITWNDSWFRGDAFNNQQFPNAIDPTIYYSPDGKMYMTYGSWSGGIFTLEIDKATGRVIHPKTGKTSDERLVDSYFGTKISGGYGKSGEGPFIEYNDETGYYYLWVTYGGLTSEGGYNMRVFRSKAPEGPYLDAAGNPAVLGSNSNLDSIGLKVMGNYKFSSLSKAYMAPGHNSVLKDDDGKWYLINHTRFDDGYEFHEVRVRSMYFNSEGWPVVAPYEYSGDEISESGYNVTDIVGDYEFINHGSDTSKTIHNYVNIKLNEDGTVSGDASGTWEQSEDSAQASFVIGGQRYDGVFLAAQDETGKEKKVMSFTAVGSNNQTVWGVQTKEYTGTDRDGLADHTNADSRLVYNSDSVSDGSSVKNIGDTELLSGVSYFISNKNSGLLLEVENGLTADGTNVQQWEKNVGPHHEWRITDLGNGYCKIALMSDESMAITVDGNGSDDGLNILLKKYSGADNQQFKLIKNGSYYGIVSKCSDDTAGLDVYEWSVKNGGNVNQWNYWGGDCQLWKIAPVYPAVNDGTYTLRNVNSSKYVSVSDGNVIQDSRADIWTFKNLGDGTYSITDQNGNALTVENENGDDGNNISVSAYTGVAAQKFSIQCNEDGSYSVLSAVSDGRSCLDVYEISSEDGANICQWNFWGGDGQKFVIEPAKIPEKIIGDVNADGKFSVADLVMAEKFLLGSSSELTDWEAGDLCKDGVFDTFDLIAMRKLVK
ncbi:MAG: RICIN domain-containing protein [Ruminococcus sp.]|nr:RICIN domain-containing protein [Ruminococcus sp.]MBO5164903.1 RICIN domain-containing protein [Ruminococcus sp.]